MEFARAATVIGGPRGRWSVGPTSISRGLLAAITLHLAQPGGLAEFLDRKLHGPAPALADLANHQHRRVGVAGVETPIQSEV